jgi:hypothetical protein
MSQRPLLALLAAACLSACSAGGKDAAAKSNCASPTDPSQSDGLVAQAIGPYVTTLDPLPKRFLYTEGADSSLGSVAAQSLAEHGPFYLLPMQESQQKQMKSELKAKAGSWVTLLVTKGPVKQVDDSTAAVSLRGSYYWFGDKAGQPSAPKDILFACRSVNGIWNWVPKT